MIPTIKNKILAIIPAVGEKSQLGYRMSLFVSTTLPQVACQLPYPLHNNRLLVVWLAIFHNENCCMETVHLLNSPANAAHLERSIAQFRAVKAIDRDLVDD